jgi:hypothetical protein
MKIIPGQVRDEGYRCHAWALDTDPHGPLLQGYGLSIVEAMLHLDFVAAERGYYITYALAGPTIHHPIAAQ